MVEKTATAAVATTADDGAIRVADLLGGRATFGNPVRTTLEAHLTIERGFPSA